jgi:hypothetical protein
MNWKKIEGIGSLLTALIGLYFLVHIYQSAASAIQHLGLKFEEISFVKIFWNNAWFIFISIMMVISGFIYFKNEKFSWILKLSLLSTLFLIYLSHIQHYNKNDLNLPDLGHLSSYIIFIPFLTLILLFSLLNRYSRKKYSPTKKEIIQISSITIGLILLKMIAK